MSKQVGYILEYDDGVIVSITIDQLRGRKLTVGAEVVANGRMHAPKGMKGRVVEISEPYTNGPHGHLTSNVIWVLWENQESGDVPFNMKFKDLELEA